MIHVPQRLVIFTIIMMSALVEVGLGHSLRWPGERVGFLCYIPQWSLVAEDRFCCLYRQRRGRINGLDKRFLGVV